MVRAQIYSDSDDTLAFAGGSDGVYDRIEYLYNRQGDRINSRADLVPKKNKRSTRSFVRQGVNRNQALIYSVDAGLDAIGGTTVDYIDSGLYGGGNEKK